MFWIKSKIYTSVYPSFTIIKCFPDEIEPPCEKKGWGGGEGCGSDKVRHKEVFEVTEEG